MRNILFCGDTFLNYFGEDGFENERFKAIFSDTDTICINLETVIGKGKKTHKAFNIATDKGKLDAFLAAIKNKPLIASIANNHSLDFGKEGFNETIKVLTEKCISIVGRKNGNQAWCDYNNKKVCILGYTHNKSEELGDVDDVLFDLKNLNKNASLERRFVVVILHWGEEYMPYPSPFQIDFCHKLIDNGADMIIGHHPHVMQGFEYYKGKMIFYSLGNFNFDVAHPYHRKLKETKFGYSVKVNFENDEISTEVVPYRINEAFVPERLESKEREAIMDYIEKDLSEPIKDGYGKMEWRAAATKHHFNNNMPAWKLRIKKHGIGQVVLMLKWFCDKDQIKYMMASILSLFGVKSALAKRKTINEYIG